MCAVCFSGYYIPQRTPRVYIYIHYIIYIHIYIVHSTFTILMIKCLRFGVADVGSSERKSFDFKDILSPAGMDDDDDDDDDDDLPFVE